MIRVTRYDAGVTLLPIADRELRVSARHKATHRLRIAFAVGAVTIAGAIGLIFKMGGGSAGLQVGIWTFNALKWIAFVFACAAGVFLTSDCLSEEKREGTLGLLFLTDLRGHDVVLGKLLATSLRTFYSLLAIFPVMAFSFILGGIAADDFQHTLVSICNTLFFSLALGMAVSVISRDPHKAMTGALAAVVVFTTVISAIPQMALLSPVFAFTHASSYITSDFWRCVLFVHLESWCFLAVASWLAPKTWQDKGVRARWQFPMFGAGGTEAGRRSLLDKSPVCWIISRDLWTASLARLALVLVAGVFALSVASVSQGPIPAAAAPVSNSTTMTSTNGTTATATVVWAGGMVKNKLYLIASWCAGALSLALEFWLVSHVCRFYVDGKRNGFLELLLVTPIRPADVVAGHWLALRRLFLAPVAAQLFLILSCGVIQLWATFSTVVPTAPGTTAISQVSNRDLEIQQILTLVLGTISWSLGLFTIVWYSIWMGMTAARINIAMLKIFWYAKILPWFCITFASGFLFMLVMMALKGGAIWLYPVLSQLLYIAANLALISLARSNARAVFSKWPGLTAA